MTIELLDESEICGPYEWKNEIDNKYIYESGYIDLLYTQYDNLLKHMLRDLDINISYNLYFIDDNKNCIGKCNDKKLEFIINKEFEYNKIFIEDEYEGAFFIIAKDCIDDDNIDLYHSIAIELDLENLNNSNIKNLIIYITKNILTRYRNSLKIDEYELYKDRKIYFDNIYEHMQEYIEYYKSTEKYRKSYRDIIKYECQSYIEDIIYEYRGICIRLEDIDIISRTPYEGRFSEGIIILTKNKKLLDIEFKDKLSLENYKGVRKLLELSNDEYALITDGNEILGLSKIRKKDIIGIKFNGEGKYTVVYNDSNILDFEYGYPMNKKNRFNEIYIENKIKSSSIDAYIQKDICRLVKSIVDNGRGGMIVISPSPKREVERLEKQSTLIKPIKVNEVILKSICRIDGSIIIDKNLMCHAIGVILDGRTNINIGDRTRGARYNSALKYICNDKTGETIAIVISEDGMIDVIDKNNANN